MEALQESSKAAMRYLNHNRGGRTLQEISEGVMLAEDEIQPALERLNSLGYVVFGPGGKAFLTREGKEADLVMRGRVPYDKTTVGSYILLDIAHGYLDGLKKLKPLYDDLKLNGDLRAYYRAANDLVSGKEAVSVGECASLNRKLQFYLWTVGSKVKLEAEGTLRSRRICRDPKIVNYSLKQLGDLPGEKTSQWQSAKVLFGDESLLGEVGDDMPYKVRVTRDAKRKWLAKRFRKETWDLEFDPTIARQATSFLDKYYEGDTDFRPHHSEDAVFAYFMDIEDIRDLGKKYGEISYHETPRVEESERVKRLVDAGEVIETADHRVATAAAMRMKLRNVGMTSREMYKMFRNPDVVGKVWDSFWDYMEDIDIWHQR